MMNRIDDVFEKCKKNGRTALIPFITAGDPSLDVTEQVVEQFVAQGADIIELGIPFSDPMADGPTIQAACDRALKTGVTMDEILAMVARFRECGINTPFVLFSYFNLIYHYGVDALAKACREVGIDAWLTVDLPVEETGEIMDALKENELHWIALVAPTTPEERLEKILQQAGGFIYYITRIGVTGARTSLPRDLKEQLDMIRRHTSLPIAAGFGISSPEMVQTIKREADAVVVGSKIIKTLHEKPTIAAGIQAVGDLVQALSCACDA